MKRRATNVIDFAAAKKRREDAARVEREEAISLLPFSFAEAEVTLTRGRHPRVVVVIDSYEGLGIELSRKDALLLAKALRSTALSRKRRSAHPRG